MSLPRYPQYKDSGIPWVGEVPSNWRVEPLLGVARERYESNAGMKEDNLLSLSYGRMLRKNMASNDGLLPESFETYQVVRPGDTVFRLTDLQNDQRSLRTALVAETGIITSAYLCVEPTCIDSSYFSYLLRSYDLSKAFYSMGGGLRQSMKYADVKRLPILIPSHSEQRAIAAFLDREVAKIDALVAEQEKLLALLAEKRQATISHVVTRGLNPDASLKDSGIPWLGQVPVHWGVTPLKYLVSLKSGGTPSKDKLGYWDGGVPWASAKDLKTETLPDTTDHLAELAISSGAAAVLPAGTVLVVVRGMILARTFPVTQTLVPMAINQDLKGLMPQPGLDATFLAWLLRGTANESLQRLDEAGHGTKALRMDAWTSMALPVPPESEQRQIASFLSMRAAELDELVWETQSTVELLKERRSALIAAAVTGQIDVRGVVEAQAA